MGKDSVVDIPLQLEGPGSDPEPLGVATQMAPARQRPVRVAEARDG
jgi:hypothetical protein